MAITVTHTKVSTIPDGDDSSLIRPSDWNSTHTLTGLGTMAEQNANAVAITGGTISGVTLPASNITGTLGVPNGGTGATTLTGYVKGTGVTAMTASATIPNTDITGLGTASTKDAGVANGVATLDGSGTVPISQLPAAVLGALSYQGTWNASTNTPTLTSSVGTKGYYYVVDVAGSTNLNGITDWKVGDWAVFNGSVWQKIDNTDAVTSVNGYTGTVVLTNTDISGFGTMSTQNANAVAITGGTMNGVVIGGTSPADITGNTITAATTFISENYKGLPGVGGNLKTSAGTSLLNWDGAGAGNITINGGLNANPVNKNVSLAPTGTGSVTINPATAGTMNNVVIGGTTPLAITGTTITATSFVGSGASLTNVVNSLTASTGISVSGSTGAVTVTNTAPDQTVVMTSGTGISVTGTYPNFTVTNTAPSSGGTVTSVSGTTGRITSTGGTTPVIDLASGIATAGTTGSATLIPVITIDTYGRVTSITTASNPQGTVTSVSGTGTVNGLTLTGTVTSSGSLTLGGTLDLSSPPAIGGTTPAAITGTTITATKFVGVSGGTF